ncbi:hypothetical protein LguiA_029172 [Lonicera macranthoides]
MAPWPWRTEKDNHLHALGAGGGNPVLLFAICAKFDVDTIKFQSKREVMNKRLDDYLDLVLLSAICAKFSGKRRKGGS